SKNVVFSLQSHRSNALVILQQIAPPASQAARHFVLIYDCGNDETVKSTILEQRPTLINAGYSLILGLRDLHPKPLADIARVKMMLRTRVPVSQVPTHILLSVAEIEAWFLQDHTHFAKIDPKLDVTQFGATFGFDPQTDCAETVIWPSDLLHRIYASVGKAYRKRRNQVLRTVEVIDYDALYLTLPERLPHLKELVVHLDSFIA
ncbi:MAG TPA: hypothetical protein VJS12_14055, partial [Steroidobacteraceae bacterium]|nr:hypothetical protein [Steroidobacteraceae bacterium]